MSSNNKKGKINIPNIVGIAPAALDLKCTVCGKEWSGHASDPKHYTWCPLYNSEGSDPLPTTYQCSECNAYSTVSESAIEHYEWCSKYKPPVITDFTCEKCGKKFTNYADYGAHLESEHAVNYPDKCDICGAAYGAHRNLCTKKSEAGYWGLNQYSSYYTYQDDVLKKHFNYAKTGVFNLGNYLLNIYLITLLKYIDLYPEDPILSGRGDDIIEDIKYTINSVVESSGYNKGLTITEYNQSTPTNMAYLIGNILDELGLTPFDITSMFWRLEDGTKYTILYDKILFSKLNKDNKNQIAIFKDMEFSSYYIPNKYSSKIKYTVEVNVTGGDTDYTVTPSAMVEINPIFNNYYKTETKTGCIQYYKEFDTKSDTYTVQFYGPPCSKFHDMKSGIKLGSIKDKFTLTHAAMYLNDSIVDETTDRGTFLMPHVEQKDGDHVKVVVDLNTNRNSGLIYIDFEYTRTIGNKLEATASIRNGETIDSNLEFYVLAKKSNGDVVQSTSVVIPKGSNSTTLSFFGKEIVGIIDTVPEKLTDGRVPTFGVWIYPKYYQNVPVYLTYVDNVNPSQGVSGTVKITTGTDVKRGIYEFSDGYGNTPCLLNIIEARGTYKKVNISIAPDDSFSYLETDIDYDVPPNPDNFKRVDVKLQRILQ